MAPLFTQVHARFPYFGSMALPILVIALVIAVPSGLLFVKAGGSRDLPRRAVTAIFIALAVASVADSALLDAFWWHIRAVRNGGSVHVSVGPGLFNVPWVAEIIGR